MPSDTLSWGYTNGAELCPNEWPRLFRTGRNQSPIDISVCGGGQSHSCACAPLASQLRRATLGAQQDSLTPPQPPVAPGRRRRREHLDSLLDDGADSPDGACGGGGGNGGSDKCRTESRTSSSSGNSSDLELAGSTSPSPVGSKQVCAANCRAQRQRTRLCTTNKKVFLGYPRYVGSLQLCNTGHAWQINLPPELADHTLVCGPPLGDREYRLAQLHCHWGENSDCGSEHTVNGRAYSAEIHFVHWNCTDFPNASEASKHKHGLAVLGVLVQALDGEHNRNKHLDKITKHLCKVTKPNSTANLSNTKLDLKKLFPSNRWNYATYEGSLTTPPLSEVVDWLVFLQPITCSTSQLREFRRMKCPTGDELAKNYRPVQPQNERLVSLWSYAHSH